MYFKITNADEKHNGYQYSDGLNVVEYKQFYYLSESDSETVDQTDDDGIDDNNDRIREPDNLHTFTDSNHILEFLDFGIYLREVMLPPDDGDFRMIKDGTKWRANKIILGKKYNLDDVNTFKYLVSIGVDMHAYNNLALMWSSKNGYLEIIQYLVSLKIDITSYQNHALELAAKYGQFSTVKYLVEMGADIYAKDGNSALKWAAAKGHSKIVRYLVENGAGMKSKIDALIFALEHKQNKIVKYFLLNKIMLFIYEKMQLAEFFG